MSTVMTNPEVNNQGTTQHRLQGNFFAASRYCHTDVRRGWTENRLGTRIIALTEDFLRGFRTAVMDECGPAADVVFKSVGRRWGELLAKRFEKEMTAFYGLPLRDFIVAMFQACLTELFSQHGWGKLRLDLSRHDRGLILVHLENAIMGDLVPQADQPVDTLFAGIFAGFFSQLAGQPLDCKQTTCRACGDDKARFIITLQARLTAVAENGTQRNHEAIWQQLLDSHVD